MLGKRSMTRAPWRGQERGRQAQMLGSWSKDFSLRQPCLQVSKNIGSLVHAGSLRSFQAEQEMGKVVP